MSLGVTSQVIVKCQHFVLAFVLGKTKYNHLDRKQIGDGENRITKKRMFYSFCVNGVMVCFFLSGMTGDNSKFVEYRYR